MDPSGDLLAPCTGGTGVEHAGHLPALSRADDLVAHLEAYRVELEGQPNVSHR